MAGSRLTTLGRFALQIDDRTLSPPSTKKARALLAYLVLHRGKDVSRERLLELFWRDSAPELARESLRGALWSIRRAFRMLGASPDDYFIATKSIVRWIAETSLDLERFHALASRGDEAATRDALDLYQGDFLEGDYDEWAVTERGRAAAAYELLLARVVEATHDTDAARLLIERNPYDEQAYVALIEAAITAGRRFAATALIDRCRAAMAEIGVSPSSTFENRFSVFARARASAPQKVQLPFVGRESELATLAACLEPASGRGCSVLVHGVAGIGKTALLQQAARFAQERGRRVIRVQCLDRDPRVFGPWESVVHEVTGRPVSDVAGALAQALDSSCALFVDDAHTLRGEALAVFAELVRGSIALRYAIVVASRPEGVSSLERLLRIVPLEEIRLAALGRDELIGALEESGNVGLGEVINLIYERSAGHPYFLAALLESLARDGTLRHDRDRWRVHGRFDARALPSTITRYVESQLRSRGTHAAMVSCALALEPAATTEDLVEATRLGESAVLDALDDLLALELIRQPSSGPHFAFAHDLVREVAGTLLNAGRRTAMHRAFSRRLADSSDRDVSLRLARHLAAAGDALAAAQPYHDAIQEAIEWVAYREILERTAEATGVIGRLQRSRVTDALIAGFKNQAALASIFAGDFDAALDSATESVQLARASGGDAQLAAALARRAAASFFKGRIQETLRDAVEAENYARRSGNEEALTFALINASRAFRLTARETESITAAREAYEIAVRNSYWHPAALAAESLILGQATWWRFGEALATASHCADAAQRAGPYFETKLKYCRAATLFLMDRHDDAEREAQAAMNVLWAYVRSRTGRTAYANSQLVLAEFDLQSILAAIAAARRRWQDVLERDAAGDADAALTALRDLDESKREWEIDSWSNCAALSRARVCARRRSADAPVLLRRAYRIVAENAKRTPLEADRAFRELSLAAAAIGEPRIGACASARAREYRVQRLSRAREALIGEAEFNDRLTIPN